MKYFTPYRSPIRRPKGRGGARKVGRFSGLLAKAMMGPFASVVMVGFYLFFAACVIYFLRGLATGDWTIPDAR